MWWLTPYEVINRNDKAAGWEGLPQVVVVSSLLLIILYTNGNEDYSLDESEENV